MPSLQHEALTWVIPLLRRNKSPHDVPALRAALVKDNRDRGDGPPRSVRKGRRVTIANDAGFPVYTLERPGPSPSRTVFYLHGGGFVHPSDPRQWAYAARVADAIGARVVFPLYPLAPEFSHRDSHDRLVDLFGQAAAASPDGVVVVGDSAGGGIALALALALRDRGGVQPSHLVLIAPWVDLTGEAPGTAEAAARDPWLSYPHLSIYAQFWAGSEDPEDLRDPKVSPGLGDLAGLPPALMFCGTRDLLHPGCEALFSRADEAGWPLEFVVSEGLLHVYPLLPVPEAREAFAHVVGFLR